jgi:hypothetical protein
VGKFRDGALPSSYHYVHDLSEEDVRWLSELPYTISIPHLKALVVHAGVVPGLPLERQTAAHMSRIRSVLHNEVCRCDLAFFVGRAVEGVLRLCVCVCVGVDTLVGRY